MAGNNNGRLTNAIGESLSPAAIKLTVPIADMPAGVVDHQDDDFVLAGADLAGEGLERRLEGLGIHGVEQEPDHLAF